MPRRKQPAVYILASRQKGTLYIGVTSDLAKRIAQHKSDLSGFTRRYGVHTLVYYELHPDMPTAIARESQLKRWNRSWKVRLITHGNPNWRDLYADVI
jgi:putative endonuclease